MKNSRLLYTFMLLLFCSTQLVAQKIININEEGSTKSIQENSIDKSIFKDAQRVRTFAYNKKLKSISSFNLGDTLLLDLFENKQYKAVIKEVNSNRGITGITTKIAGYNFSYCFISISDKGISISAELPENNEQFIASRKGDNTLLAEYKMSTIMGKEVEPKGLDAPSTNTQFMHLPTPLANDNIDDEVTINVLVVYTTNAKNWAGGPFSSFTDIDQVIDIMMQKSNLVMQNSKTGIRFNLVHKQEVNYVETNSNADLHYIIDSDGIGARVNGSADLVVFLTKIDYVGGVAYRLSNINGNYYSNFSMTRVQQAATGYTAVHEMGHNMGCGHHKQQISSSGPGIFNYSAGWRGVDNNSFRYCTTMTYESGMSFDDNLSHTRIPYFSSPDITVNGVAIGDQNHGNNVLTLKRTKHVTSRYGDKYVKPKMTIDVTNNKKEYGESNENLIFTAKHTLRDVEEEISKDTEIIVKRAEGENAGMYPFSVQIIEHYPEGWEILDSGTIYQEDITSYYDIILINKEFEIMPKTIDLEIEDNQKNGYTGEKLFIATPKIIGALDGHNITFEYEYTSNVRKADYALEVGEYQVKITTKGGANYKEISKTITYSVTTTATMVYPNPVKKGEPLILSIDEDMQQNGTIEVYSYSGFLVSQSKVKGTKEELILDKPGVYILKIKNGNGKSRNFKIKVY